MPELTVVSPTAARPRPPLWSRQFIFVCLAHLFCYGNNMPLYAAFPIYLTGLGYSTESIGIAMASFSVASFTVRPFIGVSVDKWSARWIFVAGAAVLAVASASYLIPLFAIVIIGRIVHGVGWAAINTASGTLAAQANPPSRRGEGMGFLSMMPSIATTITPALGLWVISTAGVPTLFILSAALAALGVAFALAIRELPRSRSTPGTQRNYVERGSLLPAGILLSISTVQPVVTTFLVLLATDRGIENIPLVFIAVGLAQVVAQSLSWLSDRFGRAPLVALAISMSIVGVIIMLLLPHPAFLTLGAVIMSAGAGLSYPSLMALAVDRTPPENRGSAIATYTAAAQVGNGTGSLVFGFVIGWWGYQGMFLTAIAILCIGLVGLARNWQAAGGRRYLPVTT